MKGVPQSSRCESREGYHSIVLYYPCESERENVHDDGGNTLSLGKGKNGSTVIFEEFTADYWDYPPDRLGT